MHPFERLVLVVMIFNGGWHLADYVRHGEAHNLIGAAGCSLYAWYALRAAHSPLRGTPGLLVAMGVVWTSAGMNLLGL